MTNEEAIKYLQQLYPNGGHCWLDEQRIEAIGKAIKALQEEPVSDIDFETEVRKLWMEINTGHSYSIVDSYNIFYGLCMDIADWQKEQLMAKAIDAQCFGFQDAALFSFGLPAKDYLVGSKIKVIIIKED